MKSNNNDLGDRNEDEQNESEFEISDFNNLNKKSG